MFSLIIGLYFFICLIVAFLGRKTKLGFIKSFTLATMTTPIVAMTILFIFYPVKLTAIPKKYRGSFEE
jgi:hypothetical protein